MEKRLDTLFYRDMKTNDVRAFVYKGLSSGKAFNIILYQESLVENGDYSLHEKKQKKEQIMINYYLGLLKDGYDVFQIQEVINKALSIAKKDISLEKVVNQLKVELLLLEKANLLFLETLKNPETNEINIKPKF